MLHLCISDRRGSYHPVGNVHNGTSSPASTALTISSWPARKSACPNSSRSAAQASVTGVDEETGGGGETVVIGQSPRGKVRPPVYVMEHPFGRRYYVVGENFVPPPANPSAAFSTSHPAAALLNVFGHIIITLCTAAFDCMLFSPLRPLESATSNLSTHLDSPPAHTFD